MSTIGISMTRAKDQTDPQFNQLIDEQIRANITYYAAHRDQIDQRLAELDREWDIERWLQFNSAAISLLGLSLAARRGLRWLLLPLAVQSFFLQHGLQGWCPPLPVLRRLGVRTANEIEVERQALKALRGDFNAVKRDTDAAQTLRIVSIDGAESKKFEPHLSFLTSTTNRVPENTPAPLNDQIRSETERRIAYYRDHPETSGQRLTELAHEWDVERVIETEAPSMSLSGMLLAVIGGRKWLALPIFAQTMMLVHALQGFYPLLPLFRRLGLRTEEEIAAERYAIKATRGDFEKVSAEPEEKGRADLAYNAANPTP